MTPEEIFFPHYLIQEKLRRNEAIKALKSRKFDVLRRSYGHYAIVYRKEKDINDERLDNVLKQLTSIKNRLPHNGTDARLCYFQEENGGFASDPESRIYVTWNEYKIEKEAKCHSLAMCWAKQAAFKMKHQPNGIDGKLAAALYKKLTS